MTITSDGKVGIGDTSPQSGLYIAKYGSNWDGDVQYNKPTGNIFLSMGYSVSNQDNWFGIRGNYGSSSGTANILLQANYRDVNSQAGHYITSKATAFGIADFEIGKLVTTTSTSTPPTKVPQLTITSSGAATFSSSISAGAGITASGAIRSGGGTISSYWGTPANVNNGGNTTFTYQQEGGEFAVGFMYSIIGLYAPSGTNLLGTAQGFAYFLADGATNGTSLSQQIANGWSVSLSATNAGSFTITFTNNGGATMSNVNYRIIKVNRIGAG
jgi:hypothetical protein